MTPDGWRAWLHSGNGYEREEAVVRVIGFDDPADIPALIVRVNDWVPQVREAAERGLRWALRDDRLTGWLDALEGVAALAHQGRASHRRLIDAIEAFLCLGHHFDIVIRTAPSLPMPSRRLIERLEIGCDRAPEAREAALRRIVSGTDAQMAGEAFRQIVDMADSPARARLIDVALQALWSPIRMSATVARLDGVPPLSDDRLFDLSCDRAKGVRTVAWYEVRQRGVEAIAVAHVERLIRHCRSIRLSARLLEVLAEVDVDRAVPMLQIARRSASATVRRIAFTFLLKGAKAAESEPLVLAALSDPSPRVRAVAVRHVAGGAEPPSLELILRATSTLNTRSAVAHATSMIMHASLWSAVHDLLTLSAMQWPAGGTDVIVQALDRIRSRVARSFTTPDAELAAWITTAWRLAAPTLPPPLRRQLAFARERGGLQLSA
ncbi:hypothetical protein BH10PSE17_BH10PSE17_38940 [soil metagenome]